MKVLGLIPARGGSKGVPGKNIKLLGGKPLIYYTIKPALESTYINKVVVSTDDEEIARIGIEFGASVPFIRPAHLALDTTPTFPAIIHALDELEKIGEFFDIVCLLQATNPLRDVETIDNCIKKLIDENLDSVFTALEIPHEYNPHWAFEFSKDGFLKIATGEDTLITRRQDLPVALHREGSVYVTKVRVIRELQSMYGNKIGAYILNQECPINIDTMKDWEKAEKYFIDNNLCVE